MGEERYLYSAEGKEEEELGRLRLQAGIWDPSTIRHLETIGVSQGWRCLEVGAGTGSIAEWLLRRVGSQGKVVATDIDTRFLQRMTAPNLEVRKHDILRDDLETGYYELVHCRKLLQHLRDPDKALKRMADALRPGGWILVEEDDCGSFLSLDVTDPSLAVYSVMLRRVYDFLRKKGIADLYIGRRVRSLVDGLGFVEVGHEGTTFIARGGDPLARVHDASTRPEDAVWFDLFTQEDVDNIRRLKVMRMDPAYYYPTETVFGAWGRKPVQGGET